MAPAAFNPGLLLIQPRLRFPNDSNAETFHRWTKLHFRDLLGIPADPSSGAKVDLCVRGTALKDAPEYSHEEKAGMKPAYMYTCFTNDIGVFKSQPYYDTSRKVNLEQTRSLGDDEKPVGYKNNDKEAMVFDIVDAKFAVYKLFEHPNLLLNLRVGLEQDPGCPEPPQATIIRINIRDTSRLGLVIELSERLRSNFELKSDLGSYSFAAYHRANQQAQPDEHPFIGEEESAEYMVLGFVEVQPEMPFDVFASEVEKGVVESLQQVAELANKTVDNLFDYGIWKAEKHDKERITKQQYLGQLEFLNQGAY